MRPYQKFMYTTYISCNPARKVHLNTEKDKCIHCDPVDSPLVADSTTGTDIYVHNTKFGSVYYMVHWSLWQGDPRAWIEVVTKERAMRYIRYGLTTEEEDEQVGVWDQLQDEENEDFYDGMVERQSEIDERLQKIFKREHWDTYYPDLEEGESPRIDIVDEDYNVLFSIYVNPYKQLKRRDFSDFYEWYKEYKEEKKKKEEEVSEQ